MAAHMNSSRIYRTINLLLAVFGVLFAQFNVLLGAYHVLRQQQEQILYYALIQCEDISIKRLKRTRRLSRRRRRVWQKRGRTDQWWKNMVNGTLTDSDWKKSFRMSRENFEKLANELRPFISPSTTPNYTALTVEKKLAITLYVLKDMGSFAMTANTFGVSISTVSIVIIQVCKAISYELGKHYLHLPKNLSEMRNKIAAFEVKYGMTQAFGCVDGTHIPILRPQEYSQDYFCYKNFFSLNVQGVCDSSGMFMDVDCKWPGSVHDGKVFANSSINRKLKNNELPLIYRTILPGHNKIPNYLIGDPAYALTPYCMKEYSKCTSNEEVVFNNMLRAARNPIECAYGRLKARWAILTKPINIKLENVPLIIYTCFVLHNYCEANKIDVDEDMVRKQMMTMETGQDNRADVVYSCNTGEGEVVREVLKLYVRDNLPDNLVQNVSG